MKFTVIHPSRGRPEMCAATYQNWIEKAANAMDIEYLVMVDRDEMEDYAKVLPWQILSHDSRLEWYVQKVNWGASFSTGDILIINTDTFDCEQDWDKKILDFVGDKKSWLLKTNDNIEDWICTLPIMDRVFYENLGYVYFPEYQHMYSDTDLTSYADYAGKRIIAKDITFDHKHYSVGKMAKDATNMRSDSTYPKGEATYIKRFKDNFGVKDLKGIITAPSMVKWIEQHGLKQPEI